MEFRRIILCIGFSIMLFMTVAISSPSIIFAETPKFEDTVTVGGSEFAFNTRIAVSSNNTIYVVWNGYNNTEGEDFPLIAVFFSVSRDNGTSFESPVQLTKSSGPNAMTTFDPVIAASGQMVYVAWLGQEASVGLDHQERLMYFISSNDYGRTFGAIKKLAVPPIANPDSYSPAIEAYGRHVYLSWEYGSEDPDIMFAASHDYGKSFTKTIILAENHGGNAPPHMAASGKNVYVVWVEDNLDFEGDRYDIFLRTSNDHGRSFGAEVNLSKDSTPEQTYDLEPEIALRKGILYVSWLRMELNTPNQIMLAKIADSGGTIDQLSSVSGTFGCDMGEHKMAVANKRIYLTWDDECGDQGKAMLAISENGGQNFGKPKAVASGEHFFYSPELVISPASPQNGGKNTVFLSWLFGHVDGPRCYCTIDYYSIMVASSEDNGKKFSLPESLAESGNGQDGYSLSTPAALANENGVYFAWTDGRFVKFRMADLNLAS